MEDIRDEVLLNAPSDKVWAAIRDPVAHAKWHPFLKAIAGEHELGALRKCDVLVGGKPGTTEELCSGYDDGHQIMWSIEQDSTGFSRMASDWQAGFTLEPNGARGTRVVAQSTFIPRGIMARLMMPMVRNRFHKTQREILAGLKQYVEQ